MENQVIENKPDGKPRPVSMYRGGNVLKGVTGPFTGRIVLVTDEGSVVALDTGTIFASSFASLQTSTFVPVASVTINAR